MSEASLPADEARGRLDLDGLLDRKVWIQKDVTGQCHVLVQIEGLDEVPFVCCTFHYAYRHTSNDQQRQQATALARSLGAAEPVEIRYGPI